MSTAQSHVKIKLREVNRHLVCRLCRGYYVDATTIAECLHSFCRSCIIKYLEKNSFCPICEVQIHKTKPYLNLRLDKALQDVVYKVVPGLYHDEMKRRREFYSKRQEQIPFATPEQCGLEERIIFSPEDSISLSLEYLESEDYDSETVSSQSSESGDNQDGGLSFPQQLGLMKLKNGDGKASRRESQDVQDASHFPKRYLQCPAVVNIGHLKKFIRMKHDLTDKVQVSVVHKRVPLPDHYTLMDVAYIYTWKRSAPLRFFYQIFRSRRHKMTVPPAPEAKESKPGTAVEEAKSVPSVGEEKDRVRETATPPKGERNGENNAEKSEPPAEAGKPAVCGGDRKPELEAPVAVKVETVVQSEPSEVKCEEVKEKCGAETDARKSESPKESRDRVESPKKKVGKVEEESGKVPNVKEEDPHERLLLNPISGQLESVPSSEPIKTSVNGGVGEEGTKESLDSKREVAVKGPKKSEPSPKESKKSNVNLLKSFRKEKLPGKEEKMEIKNSRGSLTITPVVKGDRPLEKKPAKFTVEIKAENKESEYDFDGSSPPGKIVPLQEFSKYSKFSRFMADHRDKWLSKESKSNWMSLQDFRAKMLKENNSNEAEAVKKKEKRKVVPSLYKINADKSKTTVRKTPNGKVPTDKWKGSKIPRTVINIKTAIDDEKAEIKMEVIGDKSDSPPKPLTVESKDGELKKKNPEKKENGEGKPEAKQRAEEGSGGEPASGREAAEGAKEGKKNEAVGAIDLSKSETSPKGESPLENLMDMARKTGKGDEKVVEALIAAAQKQSIEPLLKIPQCSQLLKTQGSASPGKNISPSDITQALQFLEELRSDMKVLESKNQLNPNSVLEQFAQKSGNIQPYQELYQQKIDLIRRLKRHQQIHPADPDTPQRKLLKLSPTSDSKKKLSPTDAKPKTPDEAYKSSIDKTLSQIQLMEIHSRMMAAQNFKNFPAFLQYYSRGYLPGPTSPSKSSAQQKAKPSSHSPNSSKSPQGVSSPAGNAAPSPDAPYFSPPGYLSGLNSEMTYHQMFQSYLNQQEQMNQVKLSQGGKKPVKFSEVSAKALSEKYYVPQTTAKKQEPSNSVAPPQKS